MYHCYMRYHEDQGMMGQFMVLGRGRCPRPLGAPHAGRH
ncbi:multicopper oxidase domain-containing protein [Streptomyces sp. NBC_00691]